MISEAAFNLADVRGPLPVIASGFLMLAVVMVAVIVKRSIN